MQIVYSQTFQIIPLSSWPASGICSITTVLTIGQHYLEAYFGKGFGQKETEAAEKRALKREARRA